MDTKTGQLIGRHMKRETSNLLWTLFDKVVTNHYVKRFGYVTED